MLNLLLAAATAGHEVAHEAAEHGLLDGVVTFTIDICIVMIVVGMIMCVIRLLKSPHLADRALASDTLGVELIGLVILFGMRFMTSAFIDGILILSLLSFAGTVAMAQYIARPHLRHKQVKSNEKLEDLA
ncbi:MAG: monovalent cation/H+ antiporter complex subunit F [Phycisphaeraceae bacterium JB051]